MSDITRNWVRLCALADIPSDHAKALNVNGQALIITRCNDGASVLQGFCTHMLYPLANSKVENCVLTCSLHLSSFRTEDGSVNEWSTYPPVSGKVLALINQNKALRTFETRVTDGDVYLLWPTDDPTSVRVRI
jgi:nitrite reductase/ring-hydroxylating ferredoxin subunit